MRNLLLFSLPILIVFISGCSQQAGQIQYKNDAITIENFIIDNRAPYAGTYTSMEFDVQNNADVTVKKVIVNFFDLPGFTVANLDCGLPTYRVNKDNAYICQFDKIDQLDSRHIAIKLKSTQVKSPTPFTASILVNYDHNGNREAIIPVIDSAIKREPSFKFSQSTPNYGPVVFDIQPLIEREVKVGNQVVKQYWGVNGNEFVTKFVMNEIGTVNDKPPLNVPGKNVIFSTVNLEPTNCPSFDTNPADTPSVQGKYTGTSKFPVNKTFNTLVCTFKPTSAQTEFTSILSVKYSYTYQFIRRENFVIQPPLS
ncbi:MAG: hypothetical protein HYW23_04035 [Candidatus Aenigmarchaeota archaeon]|nr:hypothetical protein [Candidatus Aenigmarchaeota archaeon]